MSSVKLYRNKQGQKLYPVCSWENNQHKLYNASDRATIRWAETNSEEALAECNEIDRLIEVFDGCVINGLVYAVYEDYKKIKDYIAAYDARH